MWVTLEFVAPSSHLPPVGRGESNSWLRTLPDAGSLRLLTWTEGQGRLDGIVALLRAARAGFEVEWHPTDWPLHRTVSQPKRFAERD